jgi:hypothetical protein
LAAAVWVAAGAAPPPPSTGDDDQDDGSFGLTAPIACKDVRGYEDYETLPDAALTRDDKLIVYFLPRHFKAARKGKKYEVHFTQEGRIRRRGQKAVIWALPKSLEFRTDSDTPPRLIFLTNRLALKDLKPGDYDYEIVLHDAVSGATAAPRILPFTILPSPDAKPPAVEKDEPERP